MADLTLSAIGELLDAHRVLAPILSGWPHQGLPTEMELLDIVVTQDRIAQADETPTEAESWAEAGRRVGAKRVTAATAPPTPAP